MPNEQTPQGSYAFQVVTVRQPSIGGSLRDESGCTIRPTGSTRLNVSGSDLLNSLAAKQGLSVDRYHVYFGANPEANLLAVYPCDESNPNAMPLRRYREHKVVAFHAGGVFRQFGTLRPATTVQCLAQVVTDANGKECLSISLGPGVVKRTTARGRNVVPVETTETQAAGRMDNQLSPVDFEEEDPW